MFLVRYNNLETANNYHQFVLGLIGPSCYNYSTQISLDKIVNNQGAQLLYNQFRLKSVAMLDSLKTVAVNSSSNQLDATMAGSSNLNLSGNSPDLEANRILFHLASKKSKTRVMKAISGSIKRKSKVLKGLKHFWLSQDLFGKRVELTFKGKLSYHTSVGAAVSVLIKAVLCIYIIYEFILIFQRKHPSISIKEQLVDPDSNSEYNLLEYGMNFGVGVKTRLPQTSRLLVNSSFSAHPQTFDLEMGNITHNYLTELPSNYGKIIATKETRTKQQATTGSTSSVFSVSQKALNMRKCDTVRDFVGGGILGSEWRSAWWKEVDLSNHLCIDKESEAFVEDDYKINGNTIFADEITSLNIKLEQCKNETGVICAPQEDIDIFIQSLTLELVYTNTLFDFKLFDDPIVRHLEEPIQMNLKSNGIITTEMLYMEATTELYDQYLSYWQKDNHRFMLVSRVEKDNIPIAGDAQTAVRAHIKIRMDQKKIIYGRVAQTVVSSLESIGGFQESLMHIGLFFVFFVQERMFKSSFIKELYQVSTEAGAGIKEEDLVALANDQDQMPEALANQILDFVQKKRARFVYGYTQLIHYLSRCLCFKTTRRLKKETQNLDHLLYAKGDSKLRRELDIVNLVRQLRQLRLMAQALMPDKNRLLLRFQRKHVIELTSSSSDSDHYDYDPMKMLQSGEGLLKVRQIAKMSKVFDQAKEDKLEKVDKNVLKGLFRRRNTAKQKEIERYRRSAMTLYDMISSHMKSQIAARKRYASDEDRQGGEGDQEQPLTTFEEEDITSSNPEQENDVINDQSLQLYKEAIERTVKQNPALPALFESGRISKSQMHAIRKSIFMPMVSKIAAASVDEGGYDSKKTAKVKFQDASSPTPSGDISHLGQSFKSTLQQLKSLKSSFKMHGGSPPNRILEKIPGIEEDSGEEETKGEELKDILPKKSKLSGSKQGSFKVGGGKQGSFKLGSGSKQGSFKHQKKVKRQQTGFYGNISDFDKSSEQLNDDYHAGREDSESYSGGDDTKNIGRSQASSRSSKKSIKKNLKPSLFKKADHGLSSTFKPVGGGSLIENEVDDIFPFEESQKEEQPPTEIRQSMIGSGDVKLGEDEQGEKDEDSNNSKKANERIFSQ
ncbi:hypothetical protein FGO68_gene10495 [Halteria grandinella]|uniref:Uncharacterized protein n=1 Tax=Halteria grandinella TaxID=5974 RepID=A0A8J8P152_HALGN|nr:hypothetical protein FGO68_gene10495 [Halteria grandinella]